MVSRVLCLMFCAVTIGCGDGPPSPSPTPSTFVLSGRVTDLNSGRPLAGASIAIVDGANVSRTATSDEAGAFRLTDLAQGGFTVRARYTGYDSVFASINLIADSGVDFQMRPVRQSLTGSWTGTFAFSPPPAVGARQEVPIPQASIVQEGSTVSSTFLPSGPYQVRFSGTLGDPPATGLMVTFGGTLTITMNLAGRGPLTCTGTSGMLTTAEWTRMVVTSPQVNFECGTTWTNIVITLVKLE